MATAVPSRLDGVDALKAVASQLIVLHHLAFYGPMSDHAAALAPALFDWLAQHARLAVQVFLVVGGFLAARRLRPRLFRAGETSVVRLLLDRYLRLAIPLAATLVLAIACAAVARSWMTHDSVPGSARTAQVLAHLLLLQDLLSVEALSAGIWYVSIDFQLFAMLVLLLAACAAIERGFGWRRAMAPVAVLALMGAALFHFNRDADWDVAAPYFFGSYGLGVLAAWWGEPSRRRIGLLLLAGLLVAAALTIEFRSRIALAAVVALALVLWSDARLPIGEAGRSLVAWLSRISYAVFLVHFPVCLLVNAAFERFAPRETGVQAAGVLLAWAASVAVGAGFHRLVEQRMARWLSRSPRTAAA
jgi:peptidoglycan/LPS O-acetylase OafA/YrhL